jgi:hypothetical protein
MMALTASTIRKRFLDSLPPDERAAEVKRAHLAADHHSHPAWQPPNRPRKKLGANQIGISGVSGSYAGYEPPKKPNR